MSSGRVPALSSLRRRLGLQSLTSRLVAGVVALVVVLVAVIGASTYVSLRSFLYTRLDQQLALIATGNENRIEQCIAVGAAGCSLGGDGPRGFQAPQTEWLTVLDAHGELAIEGLASSSFLRLMQLSAHQRHELVSAAPTVRSLSTTDGADLRVHTIRLSEGGTSFVVVSGLSTSESSTTLRRLLGIELVIGAAAVALAFGATSWGVRRSLRNLRRVTGTAQEVTAELSPTGAGLDRRVPVAEHGTEVGQLAESMNTLLAAVETQFAARLSSEQRMRQFLADASHELRTPLTSIRGYAELARMQRAAGSDDAGDNLDRIESEGTRMSRLVDDLLLLARDDAASADDAAPAPKNELVDVVDLLDDAAAGSRAAFPQRRIDVEKQAVPDVLGDRDQLLRVVRNLITNAAVHTAPQGGIRVRCLAGGGDVVITVADDGPGLPPEEAARVFERFWRADKARTRARGGSGLGMSIVATIVAAHGGTVRFDSSPEGGSTVLVRLPAAAENFELSAPDGYRAPQGADVSGG